MGVALETVRQVGVALGSLLRGVDVAASEWPGLHSRDDTVGRRNETASSGEAPVEGCSGDGVRGRVGVGVGGGVRPTGTTAVSSRGGPALCRNGLGGGWTREGWRRVEAAWRRRGLRCSSSAWMCCRYWASSPISPSSLSSPSSDEGVRGGGGTDCKVGGAEREGRPGMGGSVGETQEAVAISGGGREPGAVEEGRGIRGGRRPGWHPG